MFFNSGSSGRNRVSSAVAGALGNRHWITRKDELTPDYAPDYAPPLASGTTSAREASIPLWAGDRGASVSSTLSTG